MKKILFVLLLVACQLEIQGEVYLPSFPSDVQKYLLYSDQSQKRYTKRNPSSILNTLIGDTLYISYSGASKHSYNWDSYECAFTRDIPDTIWINKKKRNNIEGKHYFLDTIYRSTPAIQVYYPKTSISQRELRSLYDSIVILGVDNGKYKFISLKTRERGKWNPYIHSTRISSKPVANRLTNLLHEYPFYLATREGIPYHRTGRDTIICQCKVKNIGYTFSKYDINSNNVFEFSFPSRNDTTDIIITIHEDCNKYYDYNYKDGVFVPKEIGDRMFFVRDSIKAANDSIEQTKLPFDSIFLCEGKVDESILKLAGASFPESYWNYKNAHVYVVSFVDDKYLDRYSVVYKGKCYSISKSYLECSDNNALNYLHERGAKGREVREQNALKADEKYWFKVRQNAKIAKEKSEREKKELLQELKMKEYFLIDFPSAVEKASSDYEGISFKFYNCYDKTVNYIYYKAVAYNSVGDQQYDLSGKSTKYLEIVGPIHPGDTNWEYNNEIFYDSEEKISKIRIEEMRIVFSDGTSKHFKSYSEILSHYKYANL